MFFLSQEGLSRFQTGTNHQYHQFWTAWLMPSPTDPPAPHSEWAWSFCLHRFCGRPSGTGPPNKCSEKISVAGNRFKGCEACQNRGKNKATTPNLQQVICKSPAVLPQWKNPFSDHLDVQLSGDSPLSLQVGLWVTLKPCALPWFPSLFRVRRVKTAHLSTSQTCYLRAWTKLLQLIDPTSSNVDNWNVGTFSSPDFPSQQLWDFQSKALSPASFQGRPPRSRSTSKWHRWPSGGSLRWPPQRPPSWRSARPSPWDLERWMFMDFFRAFWDVYDFYSSKKGWHIQSYSHILHTIDDP